MNFLWYLSLLDLRRNYYASSNLIMIKYFIELCCYLFVLSIVIEKKNAWSQRKQINRIFLQWKGNYLNSNFTEVPRVQVMIQVMAWHQIFNKPSSEPTVAYLSFMFSVQFHRHRVFRCCSEDFCLSCQNRLCQTLHIWDKERIHSSEKMYWMTCVWPWPKVMVVGLINKNLLVCTLKWEKAANFFYSHWFSISHFIVQTSKFLLSD